MSAEFAPRRLFVAGATGATGRVVVRLAEEQGVDVVPHLRPKSAAKGAHPKAAVCELSDAPALEAAMRGSSTVMQLIGTMRKRFAAGDTYESSDIATTVYLAEAARKCAVDHFILLSSVGAGSPVGAYLKAKALAEEAVVRSGVPYTILRPSSFDGGGHRPPPGTYLLTRLPGLGKYRPIALEDLARTLLH
ncbi:MAG: NAD(P)H-binding protein, partial [Candidatus Methylomirabilis sp.]|nr:NAD(P)H-binding protein [Deltaproteobacteria bacterium]